MKKLLCLSLLMLGTGIYSFSQDTTSLRLVAISNGDGFSFFRDDTTHLSSVTIPMNSSARAIALFFDPVQGKLVSLHDSIDNGNRRFYDVQPFTGNFQLLYAPAENFLASADITPNGEVFAITGNGNITPSYLYKIDLTGQTETAVHPFNLEPGNSMALEFHPASNALYLFSGSQDSVFTYDITTTTENRLFLDHSFEFFKGAYFDGNQFLLSTSDLYTWDGSAGNVDYRLGLNDFYADLELLDLIPQQDTSAICPGDSVLFTARFISDNYKWYHNGVALPNSNQDSIYVSQAGTYQLLVEIGNGTNQYMWSEPVWINLLNLPVVNLSVTDSIICPGDSVLITGTSGGSSQWYLNGNPISGATANNYYATQAGLYNMIKTNQNGCADSAATPIQIYDGTIGDCTLDVETIATVFSVFPTPATDLLTIRTHGHIISSYRIMDLSGKIISSAAFTQAGDPQLNIAFLHAGVYLLQVESENNTWSTLRIVKQ